MPWIAPDAEPAVGGRATLDGGRVVPQTPSLE